MVTQPPRGRWGTREMTSMTCIYKYVVITGMAEQREGTSTNDDRRSPSAWRAGDFNGNYGQYCGAGCVKA